jgi:hypothetical protein
LGEYEGARGSMLAMWMRRSRGEKLCRRHAGGSLIDHALVADTDPDATSPELFAFVSDAGDDPPLYSSGRRGKRKVGRPRKWIGEKGTGEFSW